MTNEHKFEWNEKKKELHEIRRGDQLVDSKNQKVDGSYENKSIYPEKTALEMVRELERQMKEASLSHETQKAQLKEMKKMLRPVSKEFYEKFRSCMTRIGMDKQEQAVKNTEESIKVLGEQIDQIKKVMKI